MTVTGQMETVPWPRTPTGITSTSQCVTPNGAKTAGLMAQTDTPGRRLMHSPLIIPNDDETERARVRAARAEQRRRSFGYLQSEGTEQTSSQQDSNILSQEDLSSLVQNCLKLSSANKINQNNTWDLELIPHLSELVKNDVGDDELFNFQRASCFLETGVKIYGHRVDSVHSEAYKVLSGLSRSANEQATSESTAEDETHQGPNSSQGSKEAPRKGGSTLLASNETINLKKVDVAFNVDPLFQQTSALFDDGGAQGLLLHNLSVYSGCEVVFDSCEVPEVKMKAQAAALSKEIAVTVDLSFMKETLELMMEELRQEPEMTPTLKEIVKLLDDPRRAEFESERAQKVQSSLTPDSISSTRSWADTADFDGAQDDDPGEIFNEGFECESMGTEDTGCFNEGGSPASGAWSDSDGEQEDDDEAGDDSGEAFMSEEALEWLVMSSAGMPPKSNAWAGPDHWKFPKPKEDPSNCQADDQAKEKPVKKKRVPLFIDYNNPTECDLSAFHPPERKRSLLLPTNSKNPKETLLPEDFHFEADSLFKLILRPLVWICRRRKRRSRRFEREDPAENAHDMSNEAMWGDDDPAGEWADETGHSDVEDPSGTDLVPEPRKVRKLDVTYDKRAKQVDVRLLKGMIWEQVQHGSPEDNQEKDISDGDQGRSFQEILRHFPENCPAAAPEDISVHLCFICLLHLANEHGLRIDDCPTMDDLQIYFPHDTSEVLDA